MSDSQGRGQLESLHEDVLISILSACPSLNDLGAFIKASPVLYRIFESHKATVLVHVVAGELGPATREAAILTRTARFDGKDYKEEVAAAVADYRRCLEIVEPPWVKGLDSDAAVSLAKVARILLYFVDLYGSFRLHYFHNILDPPQPHHQSLSSTERQRVALALARYQLLFHMHGWGYGPYCDYDFFLGQVTSPFEDWEMEQVSQMDHFIGGLCGSCALLEKKKRDPETGKYNRPGHQYYIDKYSPNLEAFRHHLRAAVADDDTLMAQLADGNGVSGGVIDGCFSPAFWLQGSHSVATPQQKTAPVSVGRAKDFSGTESHVEAPWAWVDALQGKETGRWGLQLVVAPSNAERRSKPFKQAVSTLQRWRFLGLVFWDRTRAQELLKSRALQSCGTGWIAKWQGTTDGAHGTT